MSSIGARLRRLPAETRAALAFFSRLPVTPPAGPFDLRESAGAWPLAGLVMASLSGIVLLFASALNAPPPVVVLLALATMTALTGGLHEDGLADVADGFGGGRSREAKLEIMRDSRLGTYGALALIFAVALKATALGALLADPVHAAGALLGVGVLSRSCAVWHWHATLPARNDGLAQAAGRPDARSLAVSSGLGLVAGIVLVGLFGWAAAFALVLALVATTLLSRLCKRQIGGHTGDTIGAAQQIAETMLLVGLSISWAPIRP